MRCANRITTLLNNLSVSYRWVDHPAVYTVAESMRYIEDKAPIKNLLLQEKGSGRCILVIMAGNERLDMKLVNSRLETKKLQFADEVTLKRTLSVEPGSVSVFGLLHDGSSNVEVVLDEQILKENELGFHPNDNTATLFIPGPALERIVQATGQKYQLIKLH